MTDIIVTQELLKKHKEKIELRRMYCKNKSSIEHVANVFFTTPEEVENKLREYGISIREKSIEPRHGTGRNYFHGYIRIKVNSKWVPEHRYIWEQAHGPLPKGWVVHHLNGKKDDNRLENLVALPRDRHTQNGIKNEAEIKRILHLEGQVKDLEDLVKGYEEIIKDFQSDEDSSLIPTL